ncbi:MAG: LPS export ABC transporter periplasmic protein LptC [Alphaproteobacteria bacterium]|nr:LPS export ABC transporter periplasmic protein LptC [Alphaproteobacteria bacterium]
MSKHRRWQRLWQFFFTGWGLVMVAALVAGSLFTKQLLWSPISAISVNDVISNQFKMSGASFAGIDENGDPFKINARVGRQEYDKPDIILLETVSGYKTQVKNNKKNTYTFSANRGEYNRVKKTVKLYGNVKMKTSDQKEIQTNELVVKL